MKWKESDNKGFEIEPDIYDAVCTGVIDIGSQHVEWGEDKKIRRKCIIIWELADSMYEGKDGEQHRRHFSQFYTQSLDTRAKLRKHLTGWRGRDFSKEELKGFDPQNILGKPCRLIIGTNDTGKNIVDSISRYKGDNIEPEGDIHWFSFDEFEGSFPEWMSDGIRGLCEKSDEYQSYISGDQKNDYEEMPAPEDEDLEDSIPF